MMHKRAFWTGWLALIPGLLLLSACGGGSDNTAGGGDGAVRIDGSSTVYPITEAVAEEFMGANPGVRVTVGVSGTGGGFGKFLRQEIDLNNASRPISEREVNEAEQAGIGFIELPVAYDGLAVVVNPENDFVECLTVDELRRIWEPNSEVDSWNDVRPDLPDQQLQLYGPGTDSGTYDYFTEAVVGESGASRTDFQRSEDDNVLVQGVAGDRGALGFFGLAYYEENADKLKLVGVDDGDPSNGEGCIEPTAETVGNGTYTPLSRPLLVYVRAASADDPAVANFVRYYLETAPALAREVGYVPLTPEAYRLALQRFEDRVTGTLFGEHAQVGVSMEELLQRPGGGAASDTAGGAQATPDTSAAL